MQIRGASALVTGAGRGIGRAVALALGREGAHVTIVSRTAAELDSLAGEIERAGGSSHAFPADLQDPHACRAAVDAAAKTGGGLQILVNNAGIGAHAPVEGTSDETWDRILATNLSSVFRLTRAALPHLTQGGGHVFMVSSLAGSNPIAGMAAYCASKAALDHWSRCLMLEVRERGVKVTVLAPGSVDTGFGTEGGAGGGSPWKLQPQDLADAVVDLLRTRDAAHLSRVELRPTRTKPPA